MQNYNIDVMVSRFLSWKLPEDFSPDGSISFDPSPDAIGNKITWPIGTNLLNAEQAKEMLTYVIFGVENAEP